MLAQRAAEYLGLSVPYASCCGAGTLRAHGRVPSEREVLDMVCHLSQVMRICSAPADEDQAGVLAGLQQARSLQVQRCIERGAAAHALAAALEVHPFLCETVNDW